MKKILSLLLIFTSTIVLGQNDCTDILIVCGNSGYQDLSVTGFGIQELNNSNSCSSQENNSIWFKLIINTGGTLGFTLTPNSNSINEDFDFFVFGPNATCDNLGQAIRCSTTNPAAASQGNNLTGMNETETDTSEGPGSDGNSFINWLTVSDGDSYYLVIDRPIGSSNFSISWTGTAKFSEQPTFENPTADALNLEQCDTDIILDEITDFNLTLNTNIAIGSQTGVIATYHTSNNDALIGINEILTPNSFKNTSNPQTIYLRLTNSATLCFDVTEFTLSVPSSITLGTPQNLNSCDDNNDGFSTFDLSQNNTNINLDLLNNTISYFKNETDATANNIANVLSINYTNSIENNETIWARVENNTSSCFGVTSFKINVFSTPTITKPTNILQCDDDNDGFYSFDLGTLKDVEVLNGQSNIEFEVSYFTSLADADANTNAITNPYTNSSAFSSDTIFARIHNIQNTDCYETESFTMQVFETPKPSISIPLLGICDNNSIGPDTDGVELFDLTLKESDILNGQAPANFTITYFKNSSLTNQITTPSTFQNTANPQTIYVKIVNNSNANCSDTTSFSIEVFELPTITAMVELKQCDNDTDGFSSFNLSEAIPKISTNFSNETFTFFETLLGAETNDTNELIANPNAYTNQNVTTDTVWVHAENANGCYKVSELKLVVSTTGIPPSFQKEYFKCDDYLNPTNNNRDGISTFNFSSVTAEIKTILSASGQQLIIVFYRNEADALAETNPIADPSNYRNVGYPNEQKIYIRVDSQLDNDCLGFGAHITLNVEALPVANPVTIFRECDDDFDGVFEFDTSSIESTVLNSQTTVSVSYFDENGNALSSPLPNPFSTKSRTITIRVTNNNTSDPYDPCFDETTLDFIVDKKPVANSVVDFVACDDDFDGVFEFDTSTVENSVLNGQTGMLVSYVDQIGVALSSPLPNPFFSSTQTITIIVENELNNTCVAETTLNFIVKEKPEFELDNTAVYCLNLPPITVATHSASGNYSYQWRNESGIIISSNFDAIVSSAGTYTVIATSTEGCESTPKTIDIEASQIATITENDITIVDDSSNNSITIATDNLGIGEYEFSIQKFGDFIGQYQVEPFFENLLPGIYSVFIQDKNDCGISKIDVSVIGYPKFFTPNNDGVNDTWKVHGVNEYFYSSSNIFIFNRYGKLITKIDPKGEGWNGLLNGKYLPSTDYWFSVELIDNNGNIKIKKGHFSLIRM